MKPLTNEQIWGIPDDEVPVDTKDYFETQEETDQCDPRLAGQGDEIES